MLELDSVTHRYEKSLTLDAVTLSLDRGDIGCVLGPSGCGKTTLLRCIAGFESVTGGSIRVDGVTNSSTTMNLPPEKRRIGMVFQDYALLPHLTARQNVLFALHELTRAAADKTADDMLARVGLVEFGDRYPHQLSGGQQQRIAIARALAPKPALLLMDEPFSSIDGSMRSGLGRQIKELLKSLGTTALVATHDHHDAFSLSDAVGVMRRGRLLQWDTAYDIYHRPMSRFVAEFVGRGVWLNGRVTSESEVEIEIGKARGSMTNTYAPGTAVELFLRPDDVVHDDASSLQAKVVERRFRGSEFLYELQLPSGAIVLSSVPSHHDHAVGEMIGIRLETEHMVVFLAEDRAQRGRGAARKT